LRSASWLSFREVHPRGAAFSKSRTRRLTTCGRCASRCWPDALTGEASNDPRPRDRSITIDVVGRAIDIREGEKVDARAFKALVKAAVAHNGTPTKKR